MVANVFGPVEGGCMLDTLHSVWGVLHLEFVWVHRMHLQVYCCDQRFHACVQAVLSKSSFPHDYRFTCPVAHFYFKFRSSQPT